MPFSSSSSRRFGRVGLLPFALLLFRATVEAQPQQQPPADFSAAAAAQSDSSKFWIEGHPCTVFNPNSPHVLVVLHGYLTKISDYFTLAQAFVNLGYTVVLPHDCNGEGALACAPTWGKAVAKAVQDWAGNRRVGIVGHSMGGGAAMAAAKFTPGLAAYVAMHPASILSGIGWAKVQGPILFTTGTADSGTFGGSTMGATAPDRALESYNGAELPKALVNVKGDPHWSSESGTGSEFQAVSKFLGCFVKQNAADCDWVRNDMCNDANLEWCFHWGIGEAMWQKGMTDIHV